MSVHRYRPGQHVAFRSAARLSDSSCTAAVITECLTGDRVRLDAVTGAEWVGLVVPSSEIYVLQAHARGTDPDTSHAAAAAQSVERLTTGQAKALRALAYAGSKGLTDFGLADATGMKQTSIGKRRHDLYKAGLVAKTDRREYSDTHTPSIVWQITERGLAVFQARMGDAS